MEYNKFICKGEIIKIGEKKKFGSQKTLEKRIIVISVRDGRINQLLPVEFTNENIVLLDKYKEGQLVEVSVKACGYEFNNNHYPCYEGVNIIKA